MSDYHLPLFGIGLNVGAAEYRSAIPPDAKHYSLGPKFGENDEVLPCECPRCSAVRAEHDRRALAGERQMPSAEPVAVFTEWMAARPGNRMSAFARAVAEGAANLPRVVTESPGMPPQGDPELLARMRRKGL